MRFNLSRFINLYLLAAVIILTLSGLYGLFWTFNGWLWHVHRISGWLLIAAIPWKALVIVGSLRRGLQANFNRGTLIVISMVLLFLTAAVIVLGVLWNWHLGPQEFWLRQTAISWHWMLALGLLLPFAVHAWQRWPKPKNVDFLSRRAAIRLSVLAAAGVATWALAERLARLRQQAQAQVRISGSRLAAAFTGNRFPITHSSAAREDQADPEIWRLSITGAVADPQRFTYAQLSGQELGEKEALLDCTLGWYTIQNWQGIQLRDLLELAGASDAAAGVNLVSVTGYSKYLPMQDALEVLLALKVGGEDLDHWHGYPVRAVVPSRRGWYWVKWLSEIEVVRLPEGVHVDLNERPST